MIPGSEDQRHDEEVRRSDYKVEPGVKHEINLADVIRRPGHRVANRLDVMECHALAEQTDIKFIADVALETLSDEFGSEIPPKL